MRNFFITAAKIAGLYPLLRGFASLAKLGAWKSLHSYSTLYPEGSYVMVEPFLSTLFSFALAYVLLFKTGWFADKVGLAEKTETPEVRRDDLLVAGLKLLGVYMGYIFACNFTLVVCEMFTSAMMLTPSFALIKVAYMVPALLIAVFLLFQTNAAAAMLSRADSAAWRKIVAGTVGVFFILVLILIAVARNHNKNSFYDDWDGGSEWDGKNGVKTELTNEHAGTDILVPVAEQNFYLIAP